jgi:hypothetical protein
LNKGSSLVLAYPDGREWRFHAEGGPVKLKTLNEEAERPVGVYASREPRKPKWKSWLYGLQDVSVRDWNSAMFNRLPLFQHLVQMSG